MIQFLGNKMAGFAVYYYNSGKFRTVNGAKMLRTSVKAFTLIELLVVISIISLLMGISLSVSAKVRKMASSVACKSNLHGQAVAFRMYLDDYNEIMPFAAQMPSLGLNENPAISEVLESYVSGGEIFLCPGDVGRKYFESETTSYEYNAMLCGKKVGKDFLFKKFGESNINVMRDYNAFHGEAGKSGGYNYLYADGHIGDLEKQ